MANDVIFSTSSAWVAGAGLLGIVGYIATMLMLETGMGPRTVTDAVSEHGRGETAARFRLAALLTTAGGLALALALLGSSEYRLGSTAVLTLLVVTVARLAVMAAPTDLEGERRSVTGLIHLAAAVVQFGGLYRLITGDGAEVADATGQQWFADLTEVFSPVVTATLIAACVALVLPKVRRRLFGLCEWASLASTTLWVGAACAAVLVAAL